MSDSRVSEFVGHCKAIEQAGDGGKSSFQQMDNLVEDRMTKVYQVPYQTIALMPAEPDANNEKQLRGLYHQLAQHLVDLGYLSRKAFIAYGKHHKKILEEPSLLQDVLRGVQQYLKEEEDAEIVDLLRETGREINLLWLEQYLALVVEGISKYTSFDGSLEPPANYQVGDVSCYGRSLAFRFRVLFAMDEAIEDAYVFRKDMLKYKLSMENILQHGMRDLDIAATDMDEVTTIDADFWELITDIDALMDVYFRSKPAEVQNKLYAIAYRLGANRSIKGQELIVLDKKPSRRRSGNPLQWTQNRLKRAKAITHGGYAYIGFRLMQVKLWQTSFYVGVIDGDWGWQSHEAALAAQREELRHLEKPKNERLASLKKKFVKRSLFVGKKRRERNAELPWAAINMEALHAVLKNYCKSVRSREVAAESEVSELELMARLQSEHNISDEQLDTAVLDEKGLDKVYDQVSDRTERRVAYPNQKNRSFFRGLIRGIGRIAKWIVSAVRKVLGVVFAFAKAIIDRIRKGIQLFFKGFRYFSHLILGRPIGSAEQIAPGVNKYRIYATQYKLDFDAINFVPKDFTKAGVRRHKAILIEMEKSLFFFIDVVIFVIKAIAELGKGGWVWLGLQIFKFFMAGVKDLLDKGKRIVEVA
ncbi:MAG: hypothetical protein AAF433_19975 [Bacteroidota bacterium]